MNRKVLLTSLLAVGLAGCGDSSNQAQQPATSSSEPVKEAVETAAPQNNADTQNNTEELKQTAKEWKDKTGELAGKAWDVTKEKAAEIKEDSSELYDSAKAKTSEMASEAKEGTVELYQQAKEKSVEAYEAGKEKGAELMNNMSE